MSNGTNLRSLIEAQAVAVRFSHRQIMATEVATTLKFVPFRHDPLRKHSATAQTETPPKRVSTFSPSAADIRKLRARLGLSRSAFAKAVGAPMPTINNWEAKLGKPILKPKYREALERLSQE
jgi:DNA-binding transcriptional regulator YiaG